MGSKRITVLAVLSIAFAFASASCVVQGTRPIGTLGDGGTPPGLWRSVGGSGCYFARLGSLDTGDIIANSFTTEGPVYVEVLPTDGAFTSSGCVGFWETSGPFATPLATPGQNFGPGTYMVGYELAPGSYVAPGGYRCYWERVRDFRHDIGSIIDNDFTTGGVVGVTIQPEDRGFSSYRCGDWTKVG